MTTNFIEFAPITADESWPTFLSPTPLLDDAGEPMAWQVDLDEHRIIVCPTCRDREAAIRFAIVAARKVAA